MARSRRGDRAAFSELVRRHQAAVYRVCYRVLGDPEDARDAAQEAFVRCFTKLGSFEGRSSFKTWMLRLAINVSLNERKSRGRPLPPELREAPADPSGPEDDLVRKEAAERVHRALRLLQPNHRAAVVLRDLEGMSHAEVAETLGVPEATARSWAYRGRLRLKELLT
ncbi:sigma-24 (FecI-like protein) [Rubrobacter xylanophilus]|uniref:Sigma-24 (FecI-like protein) n=1 Tax=Rubrobacter xylanophilus TaxID=49319 RepID=A0A510HGV2_9ACTN|nr:sigma-70 family RNA polymerase sigma factor [Rubrobacter xylanophilus]BBL79190.1 sigma-24 (FecI-like protein) [Rubrobacter xylanophilus]